MEDKSHPCIWHFLNMVQKFFTEQHRDQLNVEAILTPNVMKAKHEVKRILITNEVGCLHFDVIIVTNSS